MAYNKYIKDWGKILLDTTVFCDLFISEKPDTVDERCLFAAKAISYLSKNKTSSGDNRIFYVTSITVSELLTQENDSEKIRRILKVLNSKNVEFIDFDLKVSLEFNARMQKHLSKTALHKMAAQLGFRTNDFMMAREWITRDYMILMSGVSKNVDVILTSDKKTFYPLSKNVDNCYCVLLYPELFDSSEQYLLSYKDDKVEEFLNPPTPIKIQKTDGSKKEKTSKESAG